MDEPFKNVEDFLHKLMMAGGQMLIYKRVKDSTLYPVEWLDKYPQALLRRFQQDAQKLASYDDFFQGYTVATASARLGFSEKDILRMLRDQEIGAIKKYNRWYLYRPAVDRLQMELRGVM